MKVTDAEKRPKLNGTSRIECRSTLLSALWALVFALISCQSSPPAVPEEPVSAPVVNEAVSGIQHFEDQEARLYGEEDTPKRIILFIGDGMGLAAVSAASYAEGRPLAMTGMPEFGLMATHEYEFVTTDSAASATAMATGEKTHFNAVSVIPGTWPDQLDNPDHRFRTMVEAASDANWRTGLVATVRINHATPAPFAAHAAHRQQYDEIARRMSKSGVDLLLGAGGSYFEDREDGRNLLEEMEQEGYRVVGDAGELRQASKTASRLVGLLHERDMPWVHTSERKMGLDEMVEQAVQVLDRDDPEGFFLMVEGAKIDWGGHRMDGQKVVDETVDMDRAVEVALEYARERDDTLVVVTADHETGAMHVMDGSSAEGQLGALGGEEEAFSLTIPEGMDDEEAQELAAPFAFAPLGAPDRFGPVEAPQERLVTAFGYFSAASRAHWDGQRRFSAIHTPEFGPVFAEGPGAAHITSVRDNADFGRRLMAWMDDEEPDVGGAPVVSSREVTPPPKNVVLLVADGLGLGSLTASYYHHGKPAMFQMSRSAMVSTHSLDTLAADRAASATALASGHRTRSGVVGMAPAEDGDLMTLPSVLTKALQQGQNTGMVTTLPVVDALVAAQYAHTEVAGDGEAVAQQLMDLLLGEPGLQFLAGGGGEYLGEERRQMLSEAGYEVLSGWNDDATGEGAPVFLEDGEVNALTRKADEDNATDLAGMTKSALEELQGSDDGFFLVVGAGPGEAKRRLERGKEVVDAVHAFDEAVRVSKEFADRDGETLVLVTSTQDKTLSVQDNHYGFHAGRCGVAVECGGDFALEWLDVSGDGIRHGAGFEEVELQGGYAPPKIAMHYTWMTQALQEHGEDVESPRTANFVPLFAHGVGAAQFGGLIDQPLLGKWLADWATRGPIDETVFCFH